MSREFEDDPGGEERPALGRLERERRPPPELEERVVAALRRSKLIRPARRFWGRRGPRVGLALAASLLVFAMGAWAGARWAARSQAKTDGPEFMLVLRSAPGQTAARLPAESAQRAREYGEWAWQLRRRGVRVAGEELKRESRLLGGADGHISEDGTAAGAVAGYFLIGARDYEQAVEVARGCPHLRYGGTVEVRQIEKEER